MGAPILGSINNNKIIYSLKSQWYSINLSLKNGIRVIYCLNGIYRVSSIYRASRIYRASGICRASGNYCASDIYRASDYYRVSGNYRTISIYRLHGIYWYMPTYRYTVKNRYVNTYRILVTKFHIPPTLILMFKIILIIQPATSQISFVLNCEKFICGIVNRRYK
jgi:hypothetical protein